jgi:hypothetical protein
MPSPTQCPHMNTKISEPHLAGARRCLDCNAYKPSASADWEIQLTPPLRAMLEAYANSESDSNMGHAMLDLVWPVIEAAEIIAEPLPRFDTELEHETQQAMARALATLRERLEKKGDKNE